MLHLRGDSEMSKEQWITPEGNIETSHSSSGGSHNITFTFSRKNGQIVFTAIFEDKENNRCFELKHEPMDSCVVALKEWLEE